MLTTSVRTLHDSLKKIYNHPKEYLADVCFCFPSAEIWAHRAILLARAPAELLNAFFPAIEEGSTLPIKINVDQDIPLELFTPLLQFWYTASFVSPETNERDLDKLEQDLGVPVLPSRIENIPNDQRLLNDLKTMLHKGLATDVVIHVVSSPDRNVFELNTPDPDHCTNQSDIPSASFKAHKFILAAQSPYFYSLFCTQFQEASSRSVSLTNDLFNEAIVDTLLTFFYTDRIFVPQLKKDPSKSQSHRDLQQIKHRLRVMQKTFYASDYLGHSDTLGKTLLYEMQELCHGFKCFCTRCAVILPSMLAWSDQFAEPLPQLRQALVNLYCDPVHSLIPLWSQRPFAFLASSLVSSTANLGENTLWAVLQQERSTHYKTLIHEIVMQTCLNVTKYNAIRVLSSLHLCGSRIRGADPTPTWSRDAHNLLYPILQYTVDMVSQFFDFYCVEYPILLSCVDGIGAGFSVDFLEFLLDRVLSQGIQEVNAGVIYQGIVRDLFGRQEVVKNVAIDDVLMRARRQCAHYISQRWSAVKAQGGFMKLEKATLRQLAEDAHIPYRSLSKPYETEFNLFSFKPRIYKKSRRLSVDPIVDPVRPKARPRAFSAGTPLEAEKRLSVTSSLLEQRPLLRTSASFTSLTDQLLLVDPLEERPRLRFELPITPSRNTLKMVSSNAYLTKKVRRGKPGKSRWGNSSDTSDEEEGIPLLGDKIELLRRPLPTLGTIKFIGNVQFAQGLYVGIELESRLGKSDGSIDGVRYFFTDPQRALFVKPGDFKILHHQK
ncbi:hypothetical protein BY458DRAFT_533348 [Sporodiniella umbellata]|nr:hypothetical protein BY458DRAFT_533348 [Sporodiniella umbellata]